MRSKEKIDLHYLMFAQFALLSFNDSGSYGDEEGTASDKSDEGRYPVPSYEVSDIIVSYFDDEDRDALEERGINLLATLSEMLESGAMKIDRNQSGYSRTAIKQAPSYYMEHLDCKAVQALPLSTFLTTPRPNHP